MISLGIKDLLLGWRKRDWLNNLEESSIFYSWISKSMKLSDYFCDEL